MEALGVFCNSNREKWKATIRAGIPDKFKRACLMRFFGFRKAEADTMLNAAKTGAEDMYKICQESRLAQRKLRLNCLNEKGKSELEFILMYLIKNKTIDAGYIVVHLAGILMIYMHASEVFLILSKMIDMSVEIFKAKNQDALRWYIPSDNQSFNKTVMTFLDSYFQGCVMGERSIVKTCRNHDFDFTRFVDAGLRHLMTNYLNLNSMSDVIMVFISEG